MTTMTWLALGIIALILEMTTGTFILLFCGISFLLVSLMSAYLTQDLLVLWLSFSVLSILQVLFFRKKLVESFSKSKVQLKLGDVEQELELKVDLAPGDSTQVEYQGSVFTAVNGSHEVLKAGRVKIKKTEGVKLIVGKVN